MCPPPLSPSGKQKLAYNKTQPKSVTRSLLLYEWMYWFVDKHVRGKISILRLFQRHVNVSLPTKSAVDVGNIRLLLFPSSCHDIPIQTLLGRWVVVQMSSTLLELFVDADKGMLCALWHFVISFQKVVFSRFNWISTWDGLILESDFVLWLVNNCWAVQIVLHHGFATIFSYFA